MFHLFRTYVAANALCCKCSMNRPAQVVPLSATVTARTGSEAATVAPTCMRSSRRKHTAAAGVAGLACATAAVVHGQVLPHPAGGRELYALFFDFLVITRLNSSPTSLFRLTEVACGRAAGTGVWTNVAFERPDASLSTSNSLLISPIPPNLTQSKTAKG